MKKHLLPILFSVVSLTIWAIYYNDLPAQLPIHWDIHGVADRYAAKFSSFLMVHGLLIGVYLLMLMLPKTDLKKENTVFYRRGHMVISQFFPLLGFGISMATVYVGLGHDLDVTKMIIVLVGILFIIIGNYMPQVKTNYYAGIRTPWTLSNEEVWRKTHRFSGVSFILGGVVLIVGIFLPAKWQFWLLIPTILLSASAPIGYSYWLYKRIVKTGGDE